MLFKETDGLRFLEQYFSAAVVNLSNLELRGFLINKSYIVDDSPVGQWIWLTLEQDKAYRLRNVLCKVQLQKQC